MKPRKRSARPLNKLHCAVIKLAWSKSAQIILIGRMLDEEGINKDLVDLDAILDGTLTLPENIQLVSTEVGKDLMSTSKGMVAMEDMLRDFYQKAYESGELDTVYMERKWLEVIEVPSVVLLRGRRRFGKTGLGFYLLEIFHKYKHMTPYVVNFPKGKRKLLPKWIKTTNKMDKLPKNCIALIDEISLKWHAQKYNIPEKQVVDHMISISGQKDQVLIFISHHAAKVLLSIIREVDVQLFKYPSLMHAKTERSDIRVWTKDALEAFEGLNISKEEKKEHTCVICDDMYCEMLKNPLPSFWTEELSKAWGDLKFDSQTRDTYTDKEAYNILKSRLPGGKKVKKLKGVATP